MPFNGSGVYTPSGADFPAVSGTTILAAKYNNVINDLAAGLSTALCKDGQQVATANQPMGGFKHTNVADATANNQYATLKQAQNLGGSLWCGTAGGTGDVITLAYAGTIPSYLAGQAFTFQALTGNTTAVTVNVNALGAKAVRNFGVALNSQAIKANGWYRITYDGAAFQIEELSNIETNPFVLTGNQTLTAAAHSGRVICINGGNSTVTLPLLSAMITGRAITVQNLGTGLVQLVRQGADLINGLTAWTVACYEIIQVVAINSATWIVTIKPSYYPGDIIMGGQASASLGFLNCTGDIYNVVDFQGLNYYIGSQFNLGGEPGGTFRVPYLNGRSPVGVGQGNTAEGGGVGTNYAVGTQAGKEQHTLDLTQIPSHSHSVPANGAGVAAFQATGSGSGSVATGLAGGGLAHENRGPVVGLRFWIKY